MYSAAVSPAASASGTVWAGRSSASAIVQRAAPGAAKYAAGRGRDRRLSQACSTSASRSSASVVAGAGHGQHVRAADHLRLKAVGPQVCRPRRADLQQNFAAVMRKKHGCAVSASAPQHMYFVFFRSRTAASKASSRARHAAKAASPRRPASGAAVQTDHQRVAR